MDAFEAIGEFGHVLQNALLKNVHPANGDGLEWPIGWPARSIIRRRRWFGGNRLTVGRSDALGRVVWRMLAGVEPSPYPLGDAARVDPVAVAEHGGCGGFPGCEVHGPV